MSAETNPVHGHLKQLADKFLEIAPEENTPFNTPFRAKIAFILPRIILPDRKLPSSYNQTVTYVPNSREEQYVFSTIISSGVGGIFEPSTPQQIKLLVDVLNVSDKVDADLLNTVKNSARIRLFSMQEEIQRIMQEI